MSPPAASEQARRTFDSAGALRLAAWPLFRGQGKDFRDLVQRLSTQDLRPLAAGRAVTTLFLSPTGRLLHRVVFQPAADGLRAVAEPPSREALAAWLDRYTFTEDARLEPAPDLAGTLVLGPRAEHFVADVLGASLAAGEGACTAQAGLLASRSQLGSLPSVLVTGPAAELDSFHERVVDAGAVRLDARGWTQLRVEAGIPACGHELTEAHHPLEAGLIGDISFTKGCYTGQEVVARQDAYDKVARRLVGLVCNGRPVEGESLAGESPAGAAQQGCAITTLAPEPAAGAPDGVACLAFVRVRDAEPDCELTTASGVLARVVRLPFPRPA